jgi:phosphatidylinositol dimannoside acyltransferase
VSSLASRTETRAPERPAGGRRRTALTLGGARHGAYRLALEAAAHLPLGTAYGTARMLGRARHRLLRDSLRVNADLVRALGATPAEVDALTRRAAELRASSEMEAFLLRRASGTDLQRMITIDGLANLDAALTAGKGAVLYSPHIRSTPVFYAALAQLGHPPVVVARPPADSLLPADAQFMSRRVELLEARFGCRHIYMRAGNFGVAVKAANVLRENGVVVVMLDKPGRTKAVEVAWLGGRARFSTGPALVARETGAPLLDFYIHRDRSWIPQVAEIGPPHSVEGDLEPAVRECARRLEAQILRHPAQWSFVTSYTHSDVRDAAEPRAAA